MLNNLILVYNRLNFCLIFNKLFNIKQKKLVVLSCSKEISKEIRSAMISVLKTILKVEHVGLLLYLFNTGGKTEELLVDTMLRCGRLDVDF